MTKTIAVYLLDRSGSMGKTKEATIRGFNGLIEEMQLSANEQTIQACLISFNQHIYEHLWLTDAKELPLATPESYKPSGGTALLDAMGYVFKKLMETTDWNDEETSFLIQVISDGEELNSQHYKADQIKQMVEECKANGRCTISYLGCDDGFLSNLMTQTGLHSNKASWNNNSRIYTANAMNANRHANKRYWSARLSGEKCVNNFYADMAGQNLSSFESADLSSKSLLAKAENLVNNAQLLDAAGFKCSTVSEHYADIFQMGNKVELK